MRVGGLLAVAGVAQGLTLSEEKNRPVTKVITLLKDMQKQLQDEAEADQEIYDKLACWCTTNDKAKTKAIAEAGEREKNLTASIEEGTAKSAQLTTEIANLEKEVAANQEALDTATSLRQKELAEFNAAEKDNLQAISALKSAITVLSKHNSSLLQTDSADMTGNVMPNIAVMLKHLTNKYEDELSGTIAPSQQRAITEFIAAPQYANQSGEIFGILGNMKDTFEANLATAQKEENASQKAYEDLKAAKEAEIKAGNDQVDKKTQELASTDEQVAQDKQDLEDTGSTLAADQKFLADLKEKCKQTDQEFNQRQKTRAEEVAAVGEALKFLNSDEAHDLFTNTFNFVQTNAGEEQVRAQAAAVLLKTKNPKLSTLATQVRLDAFTKVKKAMDDMIADLLKEKADEIKHRDFCIGAFNDNDSNTERRTRDASDLNAKIEQLTGKIKVLTEEIDTLKQEVADMQVEMKRAGEDREKENAEFQQTVSDQRATQKLLNGAMNALKGFYEKSKNGVALNQQEPAGPPPPAGFKSYENNAGGSGVIAMITQIVNDAKAMEAEAIHDEEDAQKAYESFVKESNASINEKNKSITNKSESRATAEGDKTQAEGELDQTNTELEQLANEKADLHKTCDFTIKNFDIRQEARDQEVEAIRQAKAILSGMK